MIANDGRRIIGLPSSVGLKSLSQNGRNTQDVKEARGHRDGSDLAGLAGAGERIGKLFEIDSGHRGENLALIKCLHLARAYQGALAGRGTIMPPKHNDAVRIRIRKRLKHGLVGGLEYGQHRTNAKGKSHNRDNRKARIAVQLAARKFQITGEVFQQASIPNAVWLSARDATRLRMRNLRFPVFRLVRLMNRVHWSSP